MNSIQFYKPPGTVLLPSKHPRTSTIIEDVTLAVAIANSTLTNQDYGLEKHIAGRIGLLEDGESAGLGCMEKDIADRIGLLWRRVGKIGAAFSCRTS